MESQGEITDIFLVSVIFCNLKHQLLHSLRCWNQDVWTVPSSYCSQNSQKTESYFINQSRNPWAAPSCWWLRESSQSISFDWPFPYTFFTYFFFWPLSREGSWARGMFGLSQFGGSCIIWMMHSSSSLLCNSPGFQKASNSPTCCPDGKLAVTLLYPGNTPQFMKLWSTLYSRFLLIPVLTLLTCLPTAPQISP